MRRDPASERQVQAARPDLSTWLSANAGSGKTRVLTDRVARLLLEGVQPQQILCLTYTKAAASEMQNRLFKRLGEWAMLDQARLEEKLRDLGLDHRPSDATLRKARQLFARAIETPGGLKIQTIHSFCGSILRRFPLEAGVSPQYVELDDRAAKRLRADVLDDLAAADPNGVFADLARYFTGAELDQLAKEVAGRRQELAKPLSRDAVLAGFGLPANFTRNDLMASVFLGSESSLIAAILPTLAAGSSNDVKAAARLGALNLANPGPDELIALEDEFLFGKTAKAGPFTAKIDSFPTKGTRAALSNSMPALNDLMRRVEAARNQRLALASAEKTAVLHAFAGPFLAEFEARKLRHGWLDFDDLILKTRALLTDPDVAEWVLFRLDGGIDHILVDEAQDTSPLQWQVIDLLSREFAAGKGARDDVPRTIFVVGDKKQSIYSFQGADPDEFDRMCAHFDSRMPEGTALQKTQLEYSFRSSEAILRVVDNTFHENARNGIGNDILHRAFHGDMPGRVDLWPLVEKIDIPESDEWENPVNLPSPEHHAVRLAGQVAARIAEMIETESLWEKIGSETRRRPVRAGDVLILVQRRSDLFHEIIRACKAANLPIAGADRLKVGGELAVKDLTALLSFLATPEDDLSLAAALKSPLFGWSEDDLYRLAAGRNGTYLWAALRQSNWAGTETFSMLNSLLGDADFLRPYDLIERILTRHNGRQNLIARLGAEAEDGIDALLSQALAYERIEVPSLTGFLIWLQTDEVEIKRQMDSAGNRIRVMTVHGAKGLEAPIVILPDTAKRQPRNSDNLVIGPDGLVIWKPSADNSPDIVTDALAAISTQQADERNRLLYVAMTRAEQWLITCAAGDLDNGNSWYERVAEGMTRSGAAAHMFEGGQGLRLQVGDWTQAAPDQDQAAEAPPAPLPTWATTACAAPEHPPQLLSPSDLGGAKALPGEGGLTEDEAKLRGSRLHLLLEHLPDADPTRWPDLVQKILPDTPDADRAALFAEAKTVLTAPDLQLLFDPGALAEVAFTADLPGLSAPIHGIIDRLILTPDRVLALDYKSNAQIPGSPDAVPEGILRQMGAYAAALARIYPDRSIETAILWTSAAQLMPLPSQLVADALARATTS